MTSEPLEDGMRVVSEHAAQNGPADDDDDGARSRPVDGDAETLRDALVEAFNNRDLDGLLQVVADDVEVPDDMEGDGAAALANEIESVWQRSPGAVLTRGLLEGQPCAVGWLPDADGTWNRAALVCMDFDLDATLLTVVTMPEDADALDRVETEEPSDDEPDEWDDWG